MFEPVSGVYVRYNHNLAGAEGKQSMTSRTVESLEAPEDHYRDDEQSEDHFRNEEPSR